MNTTTILVAELFAELQRELCWLMDHEHKHRAKFLARRLVELNENFVHRANEVLGIQAMAHRTAALQTDMGNRINPTTPPDTPNTDTMPPVPDDR